MKSSAQLIAEHSRARVLVPSQKPLILGWTTNPLTGALEPKLGRPLVAADIHRQLESLR